MADIAIESLSGPQKTAMRAGIGVVIGTDVAAQASVAKVINSDTTGISGADAITNIVSLTTAEYNAIGSKSASTFYIITDA